MSTSLPANAAVDPGLARLCASSLPALCTNAHVAATFYQQDWEDGLGGWSADRRAVAIAYRLLARP